MTKYLKRLVLIFLLFISGCTAQNPPSDSVALPAAESGLPSWVLSPGVEGYICGVGSAPLQKSNPSYQRRAAMMQARAAIAREIELFVRNELKMEKECRDKVCRSRMTTRSRQLSQQLITDARVKNEWTDPGTGRLYIRLAVKKDKGSAEGEPIQQTDD